tara:strand:- start:52576 stop:53661 length:1086 start_codon:yes stop_codon:yes gene_type:complete
MIDIENDILNPFKHTFYVVQLALWVSYGIIYRLIWLGYDYYVPPTAVWYLVYICGGFISSSLLAIIYWKLRDNNFYVQFAAAIIASASIAIIWRFCFNYIDFHYIDAAPPENLHFFRYIIGGMSSVIQLLAWSIGYLLIAYYFKYKNQQTRAINAELQAREAQIKQLHQQISPHFLFNVLNSVDTLLIKKDTDNAREMVARLSDYLRQSLKDTTSYSCSLESEIKNARSYLEIERIRFGDKLEIVFDCTNEADNILVPRLILQPLIENAIKHSISNSLHGGVIEIKTTILDDCLTISVINRCNGSSTFADSHSESLGIGLKNTAARLDVFYDGRAHLDIHKQEPDEYMVTINIDINEVKSS